MAITCWAVWNERNSIWLNKPISNQNVKGEWILKYYEDFLKSSRINKPANRVKAINQPGQPHKWLPPPNGFVKMNVDAAWSSGIPSNH